MIIKETLPKIKHLNNGGLLTHNKKTEKMGYNKIIKFIEKNM
jgi:hypothetical protein